MGRLGKLAIAYRFADHARYLGPFLDTIVPDHNIVLVLHDWGSALGRDWARRHQDRGSGIVLMEFITPLRWYVFPAQARAAFKAFRSPKTGGKLLIDENAFIESILPSSIVRKLSDAEMNHYREPSYLRHLVSSYTAGQTSCRLKVPGQMLSRLSRNIMTGS